VSEVSFEFCQRISTGLHVARNSLTLEVLCCSPVAVSRGGSCISLQFELNIYGPEVWSLVTSVLFGRDKDWRMGVCVMCV